MGKQIFPGMHKMTLIQTIKDRQLEARKNKRSGEEQFIVPILTTLIGEAEMIGKNDGNRQPTDQEVIALIKKFINNNVIVINATKSGERAHDAHLENVYLEDFLPQQLNEYEMRSIITENNLLTKKDVMWYFKQYYAGQYDAKLLSSLI